jgi:hypothetical protein
MVVVVKPTRLVLALCLLALPALAAPEPAEQAYQAARKGYYALKKDPKRRKFRDSWLTVAHRFEMVAKKFPQSGRARTRSSPRRSSCPTSAGSASSPRTPRPRWRTTGRCSRPIHAARSPTMRPSPWPERTSSATSPSPRGRCFSAPRSFRGGTRAHGSAPWPPRSHPSRRTAAGRRGRVTPSPGARPRPRRARRPPARGMARATRHAPPPGTARHRIGVPHRARGVRTPAPLPRHTARRTPGPVRPSRCARHPDTPSRPPSG